MSRNFFGRAPVLMVVEPESLCWVEGRKVARRGAPTWAETFDKSPALSYVVSDGGQGLLKGRAWRDQSLRGQGGAAGAAWKRAEGLWDQALAAEAALDEVRSPWSY